MCTPRSGFKSRCTSLRLRGARASPRGLNSGIAKLRRRIAAGFTLIELVIFIVVIGIGVAGVLIAYDFSARDSADPVVKKQALAIAESLLEEIQQMPFTYCDPDDANVYTATGAFVGAGGCATTVEAIGPEPGETRFGPAPFDNVNDYHGYDSNLDGGIKDATGTLISGLTLYRARVTVAGINFDVIPSTDALQITVTVTGPANVTVKVDGVRTMYAPNL